MSVYLFDSSAILKRYLREVGTSWVDALVAPASTNAIYLVRIAGAEVAATIARKLRSGGLSPAHASAALSRFRREFTGLFRLLEVDVGLIDHAMLLAGRHGLRGYDAVQLAGAMEVQAICTPANIPFVFVSSDLELNAAASAEKIHVEDPNAHP